MFVKVTGEKLVGPPSWIGLNDNLTILIRILFWSIAFEVLRDNVIFLTKILSVRWKKNFFLIGDRKFENYFWVSNRRLNVSIGYLVRFS